MIIEREPRKIISFDNIDIGEVFEYSGNYFLKIPSVYYVNRYYNTVRISTGDVNYFSDDTEVIKVDARLVIKY